MAGFSVAGHGQTLEEAADPVEAPGVEEADQPAQDADEGEPEELDRIGESVGVHVAEDRGEALERRRTRRRR